jgi:parallel beta-helix repeat protein
MLALLLPFLPGPVAVGSEASRECTITLSPGTDLQRAIDAIPTNGKPASVCLAAGEFRLRRFVSLERDDTMLRGEGTATVLRLDEGTESAVIVVGDHRQATPRLPVSGVTIERLRIVGGGSGGREYHPEHAYLTNSAVVVRAGRAVVLRDLEVTGCRSACLLTEFDTRDVSITGNRVGGSVWDGISLNRTTRARLVENVIRGNTASGITTEHLEDSVVEGNVVSGNRTHGLYLSDSHRNTFTRNRFAENVLSGVFLT